MRADTAHVDQDNSRVKLAGKVDVMRPATAKSQAMRMTTPALTVYPDEDRMETDQPVELKLGASTASGTGMKADNATRQVKLGGRGQLDIPPRGAR
jgi:lipopolysaccharide export system protein LptC